MRKFASRENGYSRGLFGMRDIEIGSCIELVGDASLPHLGKDIRLTGCRHGDESGGGQTEGEMKVNEVGS